MARDRATSLLVIACGDYLEKQNGSFKSSEVADEIKMSHMAVSGALRYYRVRGTVRGKPSEKSKESYDWHVSHTYRLEKTAILMWKLRKQLTLNGTPPSHEELLSAMLESPEVMELEQPLHRLKYIVELI